MKKILTLIILLINAIGFSQKIYSKTDKVILKNLSFSSELALKNENGLVIIEVTILEINKYDVKILYNSNKTLILHLNKEMEKISKIELPNYPYKKKILIHYVNSNTKCTNPMIYDNFLSKLNKFNFESIISINVYKL